MKPGSNNRNSELGGPWPARISRSIVILLWFFCLIQGLQFIVSTPLWEGWDEPFHYSYIQTLAEHHVFPIFGQTIVSKEIAESFNDAPVAPGLNRNLGELYVTYGAYWQETPQERLEKSTRLKTLPESDKMEFPDPSHQFQSYESQHPPLYYLLSTLVYFCFSSSDLLTRVFALRLFSLAIGSSAIFLSFSAATYVFRERRHLVCVPLIVALAPAFYSTVGRISNDSLAVSLFSLLIVATLKYFDGHETLRHAIYIGVILGLGLLTKAYFLTSLPALAVLFALACMAGRPLRRTLSHACIVGILAAIIAGWWYVRNYILYGDASGLQQFTLARKLSFLDRVRAIGIVPWMASIKEMTTQHIWIGNNSYLRLSGITYNVGFVLIVIAIFGVAKAGIVGAKHLKWASLLDRSGSGSVLILAIFYLFFVLGLLFNFLMSFLLTGAAEGTGGWYLYAVIVPEVILLVYGFESMTGRVWRKAGVLLVAYIFVVDFLSFYCKAIPAYGGFYISHFHVRDFVTIYSPSNLGILIDHLSINQAFFITPRITGLLIALDVLLLIFTMIWSMRLLLSKQVHTDLPSL